MSHPAEPLIGVPSRNPCGRGSCAACRLFEFRTERLSLRLILRRVRQGGFVLEHLAERDEAMQLMADVSPVGGPYGLRIYVCPKCERSLDQLIPAHASA